MKITIFDAKSKRIKYPDSPFEDDTFLFQNVEVQTNQQFYNCITSYFCLKQPLNLNAPLRAKRDKVDLEKFFSDSYDYIIINTNFKDTENIKRFVEYFRQYRSIFGASRAVNDTYDIKGVVFTERCEYSKLRIMFMKIQKELKGICTLSTNDIFRSYFDAPINKCKIILNNEDSKLFQIPEETATDLIEKVEKPMFLTSTTVKEACIEAFANLGFEIVEKGDKITTYKLDDDTYFWYENNPYFMFNKDTTKSLNIFNIVNKNINEDVDFSLYFKEINSFHTYRMIFDDNEFLSSKIENFLFSKKSTLTIKSCMGSGKSNLIRDIILKAQEKNLKVLVITNRISVAKEFKEKYKLKLYLDLNYKVGDSLVCQFDSLYKYQIKNFDVVVMDEFLSLLLYSRDSKTNNPQSIRRFYESFEKSLVIADAFLTGYEQNIVNRTKDYYSIVNDYKDAVNLYEIPDKKSFFYYVLNSCKVGEKNTISCTSNNMIITLQKLLTEKGLKVQTYTSDLSSITKSLIQKWMLEKDHTKWDVLIYSPSMTVGVNNLNLVKNHFHFESCRAIDPVSSVQMIKRSRFAENIYYFIDNYKDYNTILDYNVLRNQLLQQQKIPENDTFKTINKYGEVILTENGIRFVKIELLFNILKRNFKKSFEYLLSCNFSNKPKQLLKQEFNTENIMISYKEDIMKSISELEFNNLFETDISFNVQKIFDYIFENSNLEISDKESFKIIKEVAIIYAKDNDFINKILRYNFTTLTHSKVSLLKRLENKSSRFLELYLKYYDFRTRSYSPTNTEYQEFLRLIGYDTLKQELSNEIIKYKDYFKNDINE